MASRSGDEDQLLTDAASFDKDAFLRVEGEFVRERMSGSAPSEAGRSRATQHWLTVGQGLEREGNGRVATERGQTIRYCQKQHTHTMRELHCHF